MMFRDFFFSSFDAARRRLDILISNLLSGQ